jgi:chaperonin GroES
MTTKIIPNYNKVFIKIDPEKEKTSGGIIIPTMAEAERRNLRGTVISTGPGRITEQGVTIPCSVKDGDRVVVTAFAGMPVIIDKQQYTVLGDCDIICIIEEDKTEDEYKPV